MLRDKVYREESFTRCDKLQQRMLSLDLYRLPFRLLLPDNQDQYRTFLGSILSIFTVVIILTYTGYKMAQLASTEEFKIQLRQKDYFYDPKSVFSSQSDHFNLAAAITAYDGDPDPIEDETYGSVVFKRKIWD